MSKNTIKWILMEVSHDLAIGIFTSFIAIYLWQSQNNLTLILKFYLALFAGIPFFGFIGAYISKKISTKLSFLISFLVQIFAALSPLYLQKYFIGHVEIFGILTAIAIAFYSTPRNTAFQLVVDKSYRSKAVAILGSIGSLLNVITPILGSIWITFTHSYKGIFLLATVFLFISFAILLLSSIPSSNKEWNLKKALKIFNNGDFVMLNYSIFIDGIKNGFFWSVFGVLTLFLFKNNLPNWGILNSAVNLTTVIAGIFYAKYIADKYDLSTFIVAGVIYTALGVLFVANFNLVSLIPFLLLQSIINLIIDISNSQVRQKILLEYDGFAESGYEYYSLLEVPLATGRLIPIIFLLVTKSQFDNDLAIKLMLIFIATMPLISSSILSKTKLFKVNFFKS